LGYYFIFFYTVAHVFNIGDLFTSYEELEEKVQKFQKDSYTQLWSAETRGKTGLLGEDQD